MQPRQMLHLVRSGYALATPLDLELLSACPELRVLEERWVPRWALEAKSSLEGAGYTPDQVRQLFAQGSERVQGELHELVKQGKRTRVVEPRLPYAPQVIDLPTELALNRTLRRHTALCNACSADQPCPEGDELREELELLFPRDRRRTPRPGAVRRLRD